MDNESKEKYEYHKSKMKEILINVILSKGISLSYFRGFMITMFVLVFTALFLIASFTPWIVGVGLGILAGSVIVKVLLADIE